MILTSISSNTAKTPQLLSFITPQGQHKTYPQTKYTYSLQKSIKHKIIKSHHNEQRKNCRISHILINQWIDRPPGTSSLVASTKPSLFLAEQTYTPKSSSLTTGITSTPLSTVWSLATHND